MTSELSFCLWAEHSCFIRLGLPFGLRSVFFFPMEVMSVHSDFECRESAQVDWKFS